MIKKTKTCRDGNTLSWYEFSLFQEFSKLKACCFTTDGGVSAPPYRGLNISFDVGDRHENVEKNRALVLEVLNSENESRNLKLFAVNQVHGVECALIESPNSLICQEPKDALCTHLADLGLLIKHADCQVAVFYDPVNHVIANVHCGWRGNVQNIYEKQLALMHARYGTKPENVFVGISPSLGPKYAEFKNYQNEFPEPFWQFRQEQNFFNLWEITLFQLKKLKVQEAHIEIAGLCTYEMKEEFFSYRRAKVTGRLATVALLL